MTDDLERVLAALQGGLDPGVTLRMAWAEAGTAVPAAILLPARCIPVCAAAGETLLAKITQTIRLTARSYTQLRRLAAQAADAMQALGYALTDMRIQPGLPRTVIMEFTGTADGERMHLPV